MKIRVTDDVKGVALEYEDDLGFHLRTWHEVDHPHGYDVIYANAGELAHLYKLVVELEDIISTIAKNHGGMKEVTHVSKF